MKQLIFTGLLAAGIYGFIVFAQGCGCCGPCEEVFCNDYVQVRFLAKSDDSDLFANGTYKTDSLGLFALNADASVTDLTSRLGTDLFGGSYYFSYELVNGVTGYIFQYNLVERDTLRVFHTTRETDCCPVETTFGFGIFRGDTVFVNAGSTLILKK
jgi:hypothetical protein